MEPQNSLGTLDVKVSKTLNRLDQLLALLDGYKPVLEHNVSCAAVEIKANLNALIDGLYQRQLNLLKQLDKVYNDKLSLIDSSKKTIEVLRAGIISCVSSSHANDSRIHDYIARSESVLLNSSSAPFVSFRAERLALSQAINNYGRVVSRYSGHFADPSQPSSCLPLAVEEEDDHEDSQEHAMFNHVSSSYSWVKPHWRQWLLSDTHDSSSVDANRDDNDGIACPLLSDSFKSNRSINSSHYTARKKSWPSLSQTEVTKKDSEFPPTFFDSKWVDRFGDCKQHFMLQDILRSPRSAPRKQSQGTEDSAVTAATTSKSFTILSPSTNGRMDDLKDWLFCDTAELGDMPGLSSFFPSSPHTSNFDPTQHFKRPYPVQVKGSAAASVDTSRATNTVSLSSLLPDHLLASGPLDLARWLQSAPESESNLTEGQAENQPEEHAEPPLQSTNDRTELQRPKRCPYSQCIGGPGGPTCCGARMECFNTECDANPKGSDRCAVSPERSSLLTCSTTDVSNITTHPVVAQLNEIAATHWTKWIDSQNTDKGDGLTVSSVEGAQSWLLPGTPSHTVNTTHLISPSVEDAVLPHKRPVYDKDDRPTFNESTVPVQSPFVCLTDFVDGKVHPCSPCTRPRAPQKTAGKNANLKPLCTKQNANDEYEQWLLQKMSDLSTNSDSFPTGTDEWLTGQSGAPNSLIEAGPKLD